MCVCGVGWSVGGNSLFPMTSTVLFMGKWDGQLYFLYLYIALS